MSDEQITFKVTDRRLFNPDGSPRELSDEEKAQAKSATATTTPEHGATIVTEASKAVPAEAEQNLDNEDVPDEEDPAGFANFIMSIASNAASALGLMDHPVTHQRQVDLELGKHWIDVLGMLQHKTRGNLATQEEQILEGLLADLRMQYVSLANAAHPKASRTYSGRDITGGR
ncbi:MAG TPA: DUF1844 domain-containing protein [Pyrinomonadaceae bacterium]|nr:DUF1844 domain-containing protein [Pyrinomonadaceae bacterium]